MSTWINRQIDVDTFLDDMRKPQEMLSSRPPLPKRIEVTSDVYNTIKRQQKMDEIRYGRPDITSNFGYNGIPLYIQEDFEKWTEEDREKGFKVIY
ncbi:MAG: hypothetical protein ACRDBO_00100 [Lachnospiraceae bacterium]